MSEEKDCVNVAVIGSGLAGLSAAYLLAEGQTDPGNKKIQVHLFEKNKSLGMDASSISVGPDCEHRIDVGKQ
jgi:predicted NAD/FAD-binding protein